MATRIKTGGRLKGTPNKTTAEIRCIAGLYAPEAIKTMVDIMRSSDNEMTRLKACQLILDRGYGSTPSTMWSHNPNKYLQNTTIDMMDFEAIDFSTFNID